MMNLSEWEPTVRWSRPEDEREGTDLVIILHGFGADENDLFPLAPAFPENYTLASVQAPKRLPAHFGGYCWFPISQELSSRPDEVVESVRALHSWVQGQKANFRTVSLLGFSQGMAMATSLLRLDPTDYAALIGLSGFVIDADAVDDVAGAQELKELFSKDTEVVEAQPKVFWGRDVHDPIIPNHMVTMTREWFDGKVDLTHETYSGIGHGIHPEEVQEFIKYLNAAVKQRTETLDA